MDAMYFFTVWDPAINVKSAVASGTIIPSEAIVDPTARGFFQW